ncbi:MAG TPA: toll/interleukin-1 receptor domain-containing protein [Candidatus Sulfotelmatobacter sp.]
MRKGTFYEGEKCGGLQLFDTLQGRGVRCWLDEKQILPGDDIYDQVDGGIRIWDKVLLCCSKYSLTSWWVDDEIDKALEKERKLMKERGQKTLALISLDLDGHLLSGHSGNAQEVLSRFVADFRGWDGNHKTFESAVERVILALRSDEGRRPPGPKPEAMNYKGH